MEPNLSGAHILVVEDDHTIAMGLVAALEHERFDVRHVENGERAIEAVREKTPDLVLCDIMLPGMDGLETLEFGAFLHAEHEKWGRVVRETGATVN